MKAPPLEIADRTRAVLVLKLYHQCGLGIVRSLGRLGVPVYGVHDDRRAPVPASGYCRRTFEWNVDREPGERTVEYLCVIAGTIGERPLLIATDDVSSMLVAEHAETLSEHFSFPALPSGVAQSLYSKQGMHDLCRKLGIPTPNTLFPRSRMQVAASLDGVAFPLMVKGLDAFRLQQRRGVRMAIARTPDELLALYDELEDPGEPNLILQEYIPGNDDSVWMFNGYFNRRSECLVSFTGRKLRQYPAFMGMTSLGVCLRNEEVDAATRSFMKAIGYRGVLDIGWRYDARDGQYKLLDVNPRVGATFRLFVGSNGIDVVRALYLDLTDQPVPPTDQREGRKWIVENYDVVSSYRSFSAGKLGFREWVRSFRGVEEAAWFARDDLRPFAKMALHTALRTARRATRAGAAALGQAAARLASPSSS